MNNDIGLKRGTVKLVEYSNNWPAIFDQERQLLNSALGDYVYSVEHVGSTSVHGLVSKPIIDIIAAVDDLSVYKQLIKPLTLIGYEYMPERVFTVRVFFPKGPRENRTHHLSLVVKDSVNWKNTLAFRDYLRNNESARDLYQNTKIKLALKYPDDRYSYTKAKEKIIEQLLRDTMNSKK
jgi:GrpB-like predicted nucleotidyltransferase (UPF0157 family)